MTESDPPVDDLSDVLALLLGLACLGWAVAIYFGVRWWVR